MPKGNSPPNYEGRQRRSTSSQHRGRSRRRKRNGGRKNCWRKFGTEILREGRRAVSASRNSDTHGSGLVRTSAGKREPEREPERDSPKTTESRPKAQASSGISPAEVAGAGLRQIAELTGKEALSVTSIKAIE